MQRKDIIINSLKNTAVNTALEAKAVFTDASAENYQISRSVPVAIGTLLFVDNIIGSGSTTTNTLGLLAMAGFSYAAANEYGLNNTVKAVQNYASNVYSLFAKQQPTTDAVFENALKNDKEDFHDAEEDEPTEKPKMQ